MKKERGITLIALVITIIVLLILAGVSISLTLGNNGILNKAKAGVEKHRDSSEEELISLGYSAYKTAKLSGQSISKPEIEGASVTENGNSGWIVNFPDTGKSYKLSLDGIIEEDEIFDPAKWDKTASDEDCFVWASDDPNSEDYGKIVGYTQKAGNNTKLRYPSRTTKITFDYDNYIERFEGIDSDAARTVAREFYDDILKIEIPDTVLNIDNNVFRDKKNLREIVLSKNVTDISGAFSGCSSLNNVTIPEGVTNISNAFTYCTSLNNITISNSVTNMSGAFSGCTSLKRITIPDSVTNISGAFSGCESLESITIPNQITNLGYSTFRNCSNLKNIELPDSLTFIGESAFENCTSLTSLTMPNTLTEVGPSVFNSCSNLSNVTLSENLEGLSGWMFVNCTSLSTLVIPDSVKSIGYLTFSGCTNLNNLIIPNSVTTVSNGGFNNWTSSQTVKIRAKSRPSGWNANWDQTYTYMNNRPGYGSPGWVYLPREFNVVWGYTGD